MKAIRWLTRGSAMLLAALCVLAAAPAAQAAPPGLSTCGVVEITLHGTDAPTSSCLAHTGGIVPNDISGFPCGHDTKDLVLYWNGPINVSQNIIPNGPILCILGRGALNLADGPLGSPPLNWNDQASAWWAGCSSGHFDENAGFFHGQQEFFSGGNGTAAPSGNFDGRPGVLRNDSLTVVTLDTDC